jgi:predicted transcriptional regulator
MGNPENQKKEKIRLSLDVSPEVNQLLDNLAASTGGTKSDVIRKAIALIKVAVEGKEKGLKLGLAESNQVLTTEIVGL